MYLLYFATEGIAFDLLPIDYTITYINTNMYKHEQTENTDCDELDFLS